MEAQVELPDIASFDINQPSNVKDIVQKRIRWTVFFAAFSANLYNFNAGLVEAYSAPATVDMTKPGSRFIDVTPDQITWIASLPVLGCTFGCLASGYTSQAFGRRATMILVSPLYVLCWLMITYAPTIPFVYAGRLFSGFFFGFSCVPVPAYATEISPVRIRGLVGTFNHLFYSMGCFMIVLLAYVFRWSWLAVCGAAFTTLSACLMVFMPESPEWLLRNSKRAEAVQSLRFFHGKHVDLEDELKSISQNIENQSKLKFSWREFLEPTLYKPLAISLCLILFAKFAGINVVNSYTVQIFQKTGSVIDAQTSSVLYYVVNIIATVTTSLIVDRAGRRILYIISGACLTLSLGTLGLYEFLEQKGHDLSSWHWVPLISLFLYVGFFSMGIGPMAMVMTPEMVPIASRSTVLTIALSFSAFLAFGLTKMFAFMIEHFGLYGVFWIFATFTSFATLFGVFILPETKGKTINEINNSFRSRQNKQ